MNMFSLFDYSDELNGLRGGTIPYLRGMDFSASQVYKNPFLHVRLFHGNLCNFCCNYCFTKPEFTGCGATLETVLDADRYRWSLLSVYDKIFLLSAFVEQKGVKTVFINGRGEPTLEPDFMKLIRGLHNLGVTPVVATNGTSLDKPGGPNWDFMYDKGVSLLLKSNYRNNPAAEAKTFGLSPKSCEYSAVHAITHSDAGMEWVHRFAAERRIALDCVLMRGTDRDDGAPAVLRFCRKNGIVPWLGNYIPFGRGGAGLGLAPNVLARLRAKLQQIDREEFGYSYTMTDDMNLGCCAEMERNFIQITNHGRLLYIDKFGGAGQALPRRMGHRCTTCARFDSCFKTNAHMVRDLYARAR